MKRQAEVLRTVVDVLDAIADVHEYYLSISLPLWSKTKKQAERIHKLEVVVTTMAIFLITCRQL
jgi:hypothetical protein